MKKYVTILLAAALLLTALSGCITIYVPGDNDSTSAETQETATRVVPAPSESESATEEPTTEEPSTEPDVTFADYVGSWKGTNDSDAYLMIFEDETIYYVEINSNMPVLTGGMEGWWQLDQDNGAVLSLALSETDELVLKASNPGPQSMTVTTTNPNLWGEQEFVRDSYTEKDLRGILYSAQVRNTFEDGTYTTNSYVDYDEAFELYGDTEPMLEFAYIEDGLFYFCGSLGQYDENWNMHLYPYELYYFPLSDDFQVYASMVDADVPMEDDYIEQVFFTNIVGLGLTITIVNGYVVNAIVYS